MIETSWIYGLTGGVMIGVAGAVFLLVNGRIMGISGILGGLIDGSGKSNAGERSAFLAGVILLPALAQFIVSVPPSNVTGNIALLIVAGLLVGIGTRIGAGCTSGHGVCGISRLSVRSILATVIYIGAGAVSVVALRSLAGI